MPPACRADAGSAHLAEAAGPMQPSVSYRASLLKHQPPETGSPADLPRRDASGHKGTFGTVIVIGGCATMIGAPALCATAALRCGAGLVKVAVPAAICPAVIGIEPQATGILLGLDAEQAAAALDQADPGQRAVVAVGPGWSCGPVQQGVLDRILAGDRRCVLDADGLNLLAGRSFGRMEAYPPLIMTPHPGEFRRLAGALGIADDPTDAASRPGAAAQLARTWQAVVVLKGQHTIIADARRHRVNRTGNPALATAGSGDVLTGMIAAFWAAGLEPFDAAALGAHLHGLAGDIWAREYGPVGLRIQDLTDRIPAAMAEHRRGRVTATRTATTAPRAAGPPPEPTRWCAAGTAGELPVDRPGESPPVAADRPSGTGPGPDHGGPDPE